MKFRIVDASDIVPAIDELYERLTAQRDEARRVARRLYRDLRKAQREIAQLRRAFPDEDTAAVLQRLSEIAPPDNHLG